MELKFEEFCFVISNGKITLNGDSFVEIQVAGINKGNHLGVKHVQLSESNSLRYVDSIKEKNRLQIIQANDRIRVTVRFQVYEGTSAVNICTEVENISSQEIVLESVSSFVYPRVGEEVSKNKEVFFYRFIQSHHGECQPRRNSLFDLGLNKVTFEGQYRVAGANVGSWSSKEVLPQGILERAGKYTMFQIECNNSWYYELGDRKQFVYLYLGGANEEFGGWVKKLRPGERYRTVPVAVCTANSLENVLAEMTKYRRCIAGKSEPDKDLPIIFNEYMHLSWDSPCEENTKRYALAAAKAGADYYVIDCGWHDEVPGNEVYPYVGKWYESKCRFPGGLRKTTDYIRSLGMKAGLWIEPEVVGCKNPGMLAYYGDECFLQRYGKKVCVQGRYFLDFRREKVRRSMADTIARMVNDYGAEYIKLDYNQDVGIGTDTMADSLGEGLEQCAGAYLAWIDGLRKKFPHVLFETCASGGLRMDYETLKHFSIVSTSDQTDYRQYPYIVGNILSAVLPEQAAVWSYPVGSNVEPNGVFAPSSEWVEKNISEEQIIINMVNAFLGRMHLASNIGLLSERKFSLVREGIVYFKKLNGIKKRGIPVFPLGFTSFGKPSVAAGLRDGNRLYLAVWNLGGRLRMTVPLQGDIERAEIGYPLNSSVTVGSQKNCITVVFTKKLQACFLEIKIKEFTV